MARKRERVGRLESRWTTVGGLRLHARVSVEPVPDPRVGTPAPTVVLVHGLGVSSRYMIPTARRLAPFCRVYAPDLPGWGRSDAAPHTLNLPELADTLADWMAAVGLDRAAMIGNSLGCQIIAEVAVRHPARLERAVLIGPTIDPRGRTTLQQFWRVLVDSTRETPSQPLVVLLDYFIFGLRRQLRTLHYAFAAPLEDRLPQMRVPTLVVRGERDPIVPQRWAEEVTNLVPDGLGRLVVIPGAAHTVNYSAPRELVRVVRPFLCAGPR